MDPISLAIISALVAGTAAGATKVAEKSIVDGYNALNSLIKRKFGGESEIAKAVDAVEARPDSEGRKITLQEEVVNSAANKDEEILIAARQLLDLIKTVEASGDRAVAIRGDVKHSTITTGDQQSVDTGGGAFVGGALNTEGGDFLGRDQTISGDKVSGDKVGGDKIEVGDVSDTTYAIKMPDATGVTIGNVTGGITSSIVAGRDVSNAIITIGEKNLEVNKVPSLDDFKKLLGEIQHGLEDLSMQQEALEAVSSATPFTIKAVKASVDATVEIAKDSQGSSLDEIESIQAGVNGASSLLSTVLENAKTVAEKPSEVGKAVKPLIETLTQLLEKVAVSSIWAAKLWVKQ